MLTNLPSYSQKVPTVAAKFDSYDEDYIREIRRRAELPPHELRSERDGHRRFESEVLTRVASVSRSVSSPTWSSAGSTITIPASQKRSLDVLSEDDDTQYESVTSARRDGSQLPFKRPRSLIPGPLQSAKNQRDYVKAWESPCPEWSPALEGKYAHQESIRKSQI